MVGTSPGLTVKHVLKFWVFPRKSSLASLKFVHWFVILLIKAVVFVGLIIYHGFMKTLDTPKTVDELSRELAHQLAQPICAMRLSVETLKMVLADKSQSGKIDVHEILARIDRCTDESTRIIRSLQNKTLVMSRY